jgi:hypothetical protein
LSYSHLHEGWDEKQRAKPRMILGGRVGKDITRVGRGYGEG